MLLIRFFEAQNYKKYMELKKTPYLCDHFNKK